MLQTGLALSDPLVPAVRAGKRRDVIARRVESFQGDDLSLPHGNLAAARRNGRASAQHAEASVARFVHVHAVLARTLEGHGGVGRVHFEELVVGERADVKRGDAGPDRELLRVVGQVQRGQVGARSEPDGIPPVDLELDAAAAAGVEPVAERHRDVAVRRLPIVGIVAPGEGDLALQIRDPSDRLADLSVLVALLPRGERGEEENGDKRPERP